MNNITELKNKEIVSIAGGINLPPVPAAAEKSWLETTREYTIDPAVNGATWALEGVDWKTAIVGGIALLGAYNLVPMGYSKAGQGLAFLGGAAMGGLRYLHKATKPKAS